MARLDQLASAKAVAQLGATLGREFTYELLRAVAPMDELELWRGLVQLVQAEVLYQRGALPQAIYLFKHALIQEAAYQSLLRRTRQQYHQRIAQVFAEQFPDTVATQPELLAHHYTEAGLAEPAVGYWYTAGQHAHERSAHGEAVGHLRKGLELLTTLPDMLEHRQRELDLQITLGAALVATKGIAAPDVEAAYQRARELCQQVGETPQLFPVLGGLVRFYIGRGESQTAWELGEQMLSLAQRVHDSAGLAHAHIMLGHALLSLRAWDAAPPAPGARRRLLHRPAAPLSGLPHRDTCGGLWPQVSRPSPVVSWLSGPSPAAEPRGADPGPRAGAPGQCGDCPGLCR